MTTNQYGQWTISLSDEVSMMGEIHDRGCVLVIQNNRYVMYVAKAPAVRHSLEVSETCDRRLRVHWEGFVDNVVNGRGRVDATTLSLRELAVAGDAEAQFQLANRLLNADSRDLTQAANWMRKAASQGHAGAQKQLAEMYESGSGVCKDPAQAARWAAKAWQDV